MAMTVLDWVLLAVIAVSALFGLMRGFLGVLASLAAWILAGWAAFRYGDRVAIAIAGGEVPEPMQLFAGYAVSFLVVLVVVGLVGWGVRTLAKSIGLSGIDRFLGFVLGLARGGLIACVLVLLVGFTALPQQPDWQRSRIVPVFLPGAVWLGRWLPEWAAAVVSFEPADATGLPPTAAADRIALPLPRHVTGMDAIMPVDGAIEHDADASASGVLPSNTSESSTSSPNPSHGAAAPSPTDA